MTHIGKWIGIQVTSELGLGPNAFMVLLAKERRIPKLKPELCCSGMVESGSDDFKKTEGPHAGRQIFDDFRATSFTPICLSNFALVHDYKKTNVKILRRREKGAPPFCNERT